MRIAAVGLCGTIFLMRTAKCVLPLLLAIGAMTAHAQTAPAGSPALPFTLKSLGNNVYAAIDDAKGDAGANAGFVIGDDGVLVIDTFENEAAAKALLAEIRKLTKLPIKYVVDTHYHLDHVSGNGVFKDAGAVILANENVREWMRTENLKFFGKNITAKQRAMVQGLTLPDVTYAEGVNLYLGARQVNVVFFPGHTGSDSIVMVPDGKVIFCGDLFWRRTWPNLIDASTLSWIGSLGQITEGLPFPSVQFVPGHGDVGNVNDVLAFRIFLKDLRDAVSDAIKDGKRDDALVQTVLPMMKNKYAKWAWFEEFSKQDVLDTGEELLGNKKIPQPLSDITSRVALP